MKISMFTPFVVTTYITWVIPPLSISNLQPYIFEFFFIECALSCKMPALAFPAYEIWTIIEVMSIFLTYKASGFIMFFLEFISSFLSFWNLCLYFNLNFSSFCNCNGFPCYKLLILQTFFTIMVSIFLSG